MPPKVDKVLKVVNLATSPSLPGKLPVSLLGDTPGVSSRVEV